MTRDLHPSDLRFISPLQGEVSDSFENTVQARAEKTFVLLFVFLILSDMSDLIDIYTQSQTWDKLVPYQRKLKAYSRVAWRMQLVGGCRTLWV